MLSMRNLFAQLRTSPKQPLLSDESPPTTPPPPPRIEALTLRTIAGLSLPALGSGCVDVIYSTYLLKFATDALLVPPALMGTIYAAGRVWDAVSDPIVGYLSDVTPPMALGKRLRKKAVLARNCFGFIGNRMLEGYLREAFYLVEEGATCHQAPTSD